MSVSETTVDLLNQYILQLMASQYGTAYPGKSNGAGGYDIEVTNDPGKWWIRQWKNGIVSIDKATPLGVPRDPQQRCKTLIIGGELCLWIPDPTSLRQLYGNYANGAATGNIPSAVEGGDKAALGRVQPSAMGGMNVSVNAYPASGLTSFVDGIDLTADEPGSAGEFGWDVSYILDGAIQWVQTTPVTAPDATALLVSTALAVAIPTNAYRLFAVSLANGQADITQSRFVNLQDDLVKSGGIAVDPTGATIGYVVTVKTTSPLTYDLEPTSGGTIVYPKRWTMMHLDSLVLHGNALQVEVDADSFYNSRAFQNASAINDEFTNGFLCRAGSYTLRVYGEERSNAGIVTWSVDGVSQGTQNWYSVGATTNIQTTSITVLTDGWHVLNGKIASKDGSSGGYGMLLSAMAIVPSAD